MKKFYPTLNQLINTKSSPAYQPITALKTLGLTLLLATTFNGYAQQKVTPAHHQTGKIHIGLVYPLSSNGTYAPLDTNKLSLNLIAGVSAVEQGLTFAGFSNIIHNEASGMQFAAFSNHIGKKAQGVQLAGFMNTYGESEGATFAGFTNLSRGAVKGVQFAGFTNMAGTVKGAQFAGFLNLAKAAQGSQFAGFMNLSGKEVTGSQLAGFVNKAGNVGGSQLAGFVNIAKKVKGIQGAGFINVADSSDYPIGIINLIKNGEKSIAITTDETLSTTVSFRSGGKHLYGIIGIGYNFKNKDEVYVMEAGFGAHFLQNSLFRLNTELTGLSIQNFKRGNYFKSSLKVLPALRLGKSIELFGGPSFNFMSTNTTEGKALHKKFIHSWENKRGDQLQALYFGYGAGIQVTI